MVSAAAGPADSLNSDLGHHLIRARRPAIVVVEGVFDITFLQIVSALHHASDSSLPSLEAWEREGRIVVLPRGGGDNRIWATCLSPLGLPEFHLLDREAGETTRRREEFVATVNARPDCRALLTSKRSLENYFPADLINRSFAVRLDIGDDTPVVERLAEGLLSKWGSPQVWGALSRRSRRRWAERLKRWLYLRLLPQLTLQQLQERDPSGEIRGWLQTIAEMASR